MLKRATMSAVPAHPVAATPTGSFPPMAFASRMDKAREATSRLGCAALVVTCLVNVRYLTGFSGSAGLLVLSEDGAVLLTDGRYATQAPAEVERSGSPVRVEAVPGPAQAGVLAELVVAATSGGAGRVGLEAEHVSWARRRSYGDAWGPRCTLVPTTGVVERLRERKEPAEVTRIRAAAAVADAALEGCLAMLREHPTEAEVAAALDGEMRRLGAEAPAFETIVAAGAAAAEPHHRPGRHTVAPGDLVVLDFGARVEGYCSDMTRTVRAGEGPGGAGVALTGELRRMVSVVQASQDAGLSAVRAGVPAAEVDRACREVVGAAGWAERFVHGTGHGVGLEVHEAPSLGASSEDILSPGQVVTVEPGVYIPGLGGARTEDTVVVTEDGCELLTLAPKYQPTP